MPCVAYALVLVLPAAWLQVYDLVNREGVVCLGKAARLLDKAGLARLASIKGLCSAS